MKKKVCISIVVISIFFLAFAFPQGADAQDITGDKIVFGEDYTLKSDETVRGNLIILGGKVSLEVESYVNGDVLLSGGNLDIQGEVGGDIIAVGGILNLGSSAVIEGDVNLIGTVFNRSSGARVIGSIRHGSGLDGNDLPDFPRIPVEPTVPRQLGLDLVMRPLGALLWAIFISLSMGAIAVLIGLFVFKPTEIVAITIRVQPVLSLGLGLLTFVAVPFLLVLFAVTIVLLPVALLLSFAFVIAMIFSWLAIGYEIGNRLTRVARISWAQPVSAGVGTLLLTFVSALVWHIPCIGWMFTGLILTIGMGALLLSRFGTQLPPDHSGLPEYSVPAMDAQSPQVTHDVEIPEQKPVAVVKKSRVKSPPIENIVTEQSYLQESKDTSQAEDAIPPGKPRRRQSNSQGQSSGQK